MTLFEGADCHHVEEELKEEEGRAVEMIKGLEELP